MKNTAFHLILGVSVLGFSLLLGGILSLIIGWRHEELIWISLDTTIFDSVLLGTAILISIHLTRYLADRTRNILLILSLSFGLMLGAGILSFIGFFFTSPASFFYADNQTITFLLINLLFFITINIITCGFVTFQRVILDKESALNKERLLKKQMELSLLASKINPHFLFNSLNLLVSLLKKPRKAEETLINLSELLRYQLDFSEAATVSLEKELNAVRKYLSIQKMRFGEKLSYNINCDIEGKIPPMIIQPLVENCIKHNIDTTKQLTITVTITKDIDQIIISVIDSEARVLPEMIDRGVGLTVTRKRIEHFGGSFQIINGGIEISIKP